MDRRVHCVRIGDAPHIYCTCITHIGCDLEIISREEVIRRIDAGIETYWAEDPVNKSRLNIKVAVRGDLRYLRTRDDDSDRDNLLMLPEC